MKSMNLGVLKACFFVVVFLKRPLKVSIALVIIFYYMSVLQGQDRDLFPMPVHVLTP